MCLVNCSMTVLIWMDFMLIASSPSVKERHKERRIITGEDFKNPRSPGIHYIEHACSFISSNSFMMITQLPLSIFHVRKGIICHSCFALSKQPTHQGVFSISCLLHTWKLSTTTAMDHSFKLFMTD